MCDSKATADFTDFFDGSIIKRDHRSDPKVHPLCGVRAGVWSSKMDRLTRTAEPAKPGRPAPVKRSKQERAWELVDGMGVTPEIEKRFGGPRQTRDIVEFYVNGEPHSLQANQIPVRTTLAEYLRDYLGKTGTKIVCNEGGCGACTVVLKEGQRIRMANSCMRPVLSMDGIDVITTEGLGTPESPHAVQSAVAKGGGTDRTDCTPGTQCGMCTPGMIMSIYGFFQKSGGTVDEKEAESCIQGNLCRCTGYRPIYQAIHDLVADPPAMRDGDSDPEEDFELPARRFYTFSGDATWINCSTIADVELAKQTYGRQAHRLVCGNTSVGVVKYYVKNPPIANDNPRVFINVGAVAELRQISQTDADVSFGSSVTLTEMMAMLTEVGGFDPFVDHMKLVAHPQVRDVGSWAGNLMIAKVHTDFVSDLMVIFVALEATLTLRDSGNDSTMTVEAFLQESYEMPSTTFLKDITIPRPGTGDHVDSYKIMRRHMNTHTEVSASLHFTFNAENTAIASARIVLSNIIHGPLVCTETAAALVGKPLTVAGVDAALTALNGEATPVSTLIERATVGASSASYRKSLAISLLYKSWLGMLVTKGKDLGDTTLDSAAAKYDRAISEGVQQASPVASNAPIGEWQTKIEGLAQATGEAKYSGDIAHPAKTVVGYMVAANQVGRIKSIDASAALGSPGVVAFIAADTVHAVGASNAIIGGAGSPFSIFAASRTVHVGDFVGMICAHSFAEAKVAAQLVTVTYEPLRSTDSHQPPTLAAAMAEGKMIHRPDVIIDGVGGGGAEVGEVTGQVTMTGQKHFYLEQQTAFVRPREDGGLHVNLATQIVGNHWVQIAATMNMGQSQITVEHLRHGGSYGGKCDYSIRPCMAACVACKALNRPVVVQLDLNVDFSGFGGRNPHEASWTAGYDSNGKMTRLVQTSISDPGFHPIGLYTGTGLNAFAAPSIGATLKSSYALTSQGLNTFVRAPGHFAAALMIEGTIEHIAKQLGKDPVLEVQDANNLDFIRPTWNACLTQSNYATKRGEINAFNQNNKYRKRGIYMMSSDFGCGAYWTEKARAVVHADGTVNFMCSGMENGQGINTKGLQGFARGIKEDLEYAGDFDISLITMDAPRTDVMNFANPRVSETWGSGTSEGVCEAGRLVAKALAATLNNYKGAGNDSWATIVARAAADNAELTKEASRVGADSANAAARYLVGVTCCVEAEIDVLTGQWELLSCDCVHDGQPLSPAVDVGQVEGCLVMALGFCLTEEVFRDANDGRMINNGTWDYKIPSGLDIPIKMNVTFLDNTNDAFMNVFGQRCTGEPAMMAGGAAFYAVKDAIYAARADAGETDWFQLDFPASVDRIQQACLVNLVPGTK